MDYFFPVGFGILHQQSGRAHDHSRGTETALKCIMFYESLLHRMQITSIRKSLNGSDFASVNISDTKLA
jgi:hypothetical protein